MSWDARGTFSDLLPNQQTGHGGETIFSWMQEKTVWPFCSALHGTGWCHPWASGLAPLIAQGGIGLGTLHHFSNSKMCIKPFWGVFWGLILPASAACMGRLMFWATEDEACENGGSGGKVFATEMARNSLALGFVGSRAGDVVSVSSPELLWGTWYAPMLHRGASSNVSCTLGWSWAGKTGPEEHPCQFWMSLFSSPEVRQLNRLQ